MRSTIASLRGITVWAKVNGSMTMNQLKTQIDAIRVGNKRQGAIEGFMAGASSISEGKEDAATSGESLQQVSHAKAKKRPDSASVGKAEGTLTIIPHFGLFNKSLIL